MQQRLFLSATSSADGNKVCRIKWKVAHLFYFAARNEVYNYANSPISSAVKKSLVSEETSLEKNVITRSGAKK